MDNIIFASRFGAALDSDVINGGGTDDTKALQAALDTAARAGHLRLVLDGAALISAPLRIYSNTTILCPDRGCGVFLRRGQGHASEAQRKGQEQRKKLFHVDHPPCVVGMNWFLLAQSSRRRMVPFSIFSTTAKDSTWIPFSRSILPPGWNPFSMPTATPHTGQSS